MTAHEIAIMAGPITLLLAYPIFMRWLANKVHPSRLRMAALGKRLLASPKLSERQKVAIDRMLDDAFDWRFMLLMSVMIPARAMFARSRDGGCDGCIFNVGDDGVAALVREFTDCHIRATAAANPLFAAVVAVEMAVIAAVLWPLGKISKATDIQSRATVGADEWLRYSH